MINAAARGGVAFEVVDEGGGRVDETLAPLRFEGRAQYNVAPERLFKMVSEPDSLHEWLPNLKKVVMDHSNSRASAQCDVGSVRMCTFSGMGNVRESVIWWNPPHSYGFRFEPQGQMKMMMPTKDHVVAFLVRPDGNGGSIFTFQVYFNWRGYIMRHVAARMMPAMLNGALKNLKRQFGGQGGKMKRVG